MKRSPKSASGAAPSTYNGLGTEWALQKMPFARILNLLGIFLSGAGVFVAGTLSAAHFMGLVVPCGGSEGCAIVATDPSSMWFGVPVAFFGVCAYICLMGIGFWREVAPTSKSPRATAFLVSAGGALLSAWLTWHSVTVLKTTCAWCLASACLMFALFAINGSLMYVRPSETGRAGFVGGAALVSLLAAVAGICLGMRKLVQPPESVAVSRLSYAELVPPGSHDRGSAAAPITIVEFADLNCSACREMHPRLRKLVNDLGKDIRWVFRELPLTSLPGHETSFDAAVTAEEVAPLGKFWQFVDAAYAQGPLSSKQIAALLRGVLAKGQQAADAEAAAKATVARDVAVAKSGHIDQTPTYVILIDRKFFAVSTSATLLDTMRRPEIEARLR